MHKQKNILHVLFYCEKVIAYRKLCVNALSECCTWLDLKAAVLFQFFSFCILCGHFLWIYCRLLWTASARHSPLAKVSLPSTFMTAHSSTSSVATQNLLKNLDVLSWSFGWADQDRAPMQTKPWYVCRTYNLVLSWSHWIIPLTLVYQRIHFCVNFNSQI